MKSIAVIAEFNPFHNGHAFLIRSLRRLFGPEAALIILLSGSFVQRGEPAFFSKWLRARWALQSGADAVLELPTVYALSSARGFALGGVTLAARLGCTHLACGVESGSAAAFLALGQAMAAASEAPGLRTQTSGQAVTQAVQNKNPELAKLLQQPNALLAAEYARVIAAAFPALTFLPLPRQGSHNSPQPEGTFASASFLRQELQKYASLSHIYPYIPKENQASLSIAYNAGAYCDYNRYGDFVSLQGRLLPLSELQKLPAFTEGLENRWQQAFLETGSYEEALQQVKTKRYAYSRLCRMGAYTLLMPSRELMNESYAKGPQYARVLGLNQKGAAFLKKAKKKFPLVTKVRKDGKKLTDLGKQQLAFDLKATDIQFLCFKEKTKRKGRQDYYQSPVIL